MTASPLSPPAIRSLPQHADRPLWSVMIPVYNCGEFLRETLESVLMQALPESKMQIEVVDDASTDINVRELVMQVGRGRIKYYLQAANGGSLSNFESCINRAQGKFIHLLHGDDKVIDGYYIKIQSLFEQFPEAGAAFCNYRCIDENGHKVYDKQPEMLQDGLLQNWLYTIGERQRTQYAAITVRREVYESLGSFYGITYGEDWEMWVRVARHYPVAYSPAILSYYREHSNSISSTKFITGEYLQDLLQAMMLIQNHLPSDKKRSILHKSRVYYANYGLRVAKTLWHKLHDKKIVDAQVKQALKLYKGPMLYLKILKLYIILTISKA